MEKELLNIFDKELLLKDLCARLQYGVKITHIADDEHCPKTLIGIAKDMITLKGIGGYECVDIEDYKPYLFPLSSLTEEQRNDISKLLIDTRNTFSPYGEINTKGCDNLFVCSVKQSNAFINYCLMHHLDINGLIEKGLAIDATGLNIY